MDFLDKLQVVKMKQAAMAAAAEFTWSNAALQYEQIFTELGVKDVLNGAVVRGAGGVGRGMDCEDCSRDFRC